jgi:alpha-N-acetylgalactosaminidase
MGWMSWQRFRCNTDCVTFPDDCISEKLYQEQTDALVSGGYLAAGYNVVHLDDCIVSKDGRNATTNELMADPVRFPSGFSALGDYMHSQGVSFGFYTAISDTTCGGYPASRGYEQLDADTFAKWGVDYLKADVSR